MPVLCFKCECGNEFEKIVQPRAAFYRWCKHCNKLTEWIIVNDPHSLFYKEFICSACEGNKHIPPVSTPKAIQVEETISEDCPVCGRTAEHVIRIVKRGSHSGGPTTADSSVRFHFNYLSNEDS